MIILKIKHEELTEFLEWISWALMECSRNGGQMFDWNRYTGDARSGADFCELWGNTSVLTYAKTKWG